MLDNTSQANKICVALDTDDFDEIKKIVNKLSNKVGWFKINSAFTKHGPKVVEYIKNLNNKLFLDLKFHDIPNTVANYSSIVTQMGVDLFNVHALGGLDMMRAAVDAANNTSEKLNIAKPKIIAVTVLTSMKQDCLQSISINKKLSEQVLILANLAKKAGLDGVVASAEEAKIIRAELGDNFLIVTPGIRPAWSSKNEQQRIVTPAQAMQLGSDLLVIGRPITAADDMNQAIDKINQELLNQ